MDNTNSADLIPIWINLSNPQIQEATKFAGSTKEAVPFKVSFGSTGPVEEHNSFYITIEDSNHNNEEIPESAIPEGMDVSKFDENEVKLEDKDAIAGELFPEDVEETKAHLDTEDKLKAFVHNQNVLNNSFDVQSKIVGDTVYMTIKGDYTKLNTINNAPYNNTDPFNVSFDLDLSSIIDTGDTASFLNNGTNKWIQTKVDGNKHCHFGLTIYNDFTEIQNAGATGITKTYVFCPGKIAEEGEKDLSKLNCKYIRFVFNFVHEASN